MKILFIIDGLRRGGKERRFLELIKKIDKIATIDYRILMFHKNIDFIIDESIHSRIVFIEKRTKKSLSPFFQIFSIAKEYKPDCINTWSSMVTFYTIPSKVLLRLSLINSQITTAPDNFSWINLYANICKINFLFSNRIVSNSFAGLSAHHANYKRSLVIYNGFDFDRGNMLLPVKDVRNKFGISTGVVIGMVANFTSSKDYKCYLDAAEIVLDHYTDVTFLCIGSGEYGAYSSSVDAKKKERILFPGNQTDVESIINICDICVLSSFSEGLSNSILEYCALGKPVIASKVGGNVEIVTHGYNGFLFEVSNKDELAGYMIKLIDNSSLRFMLGKNSRTVIEKGFTIERMVEHYIELFEGKI